MDNMRNGKDSNTKNESLDYEETLYILKKSFELGTMFTSTKRANKKMMKTKITKELRINNANKISPGEIKLQN